MYISGSRAPILVVTLSLHLGTDQVEGGNFCALQSSYTKVANVLDVKLGRSDLQLKENFVFDRKRPFRNH